MSDVAKFTVEGSKSGDLKQKQDDQFKKLLDKEMNEGKKVNLDFKTHKTVETSKKAIQNMKNVETKKEKTNEERLKKELDRKITEYMSRNVKEFSVLHDNTVAKLNKNHTLEESQFVYDQIRSKLDGREGPANIKGIFKQGSMLTQSVWGDGSKMPVPDAFKFDLHNIGDIVNSGAFDAQMDGIINEIDIEYPWFGSAGLLRRTVMALFSVVLVVHTANKNPNMIMAGKLASMSSVKEPDGLNEPIIKQTKNDLK